jgi:hypothetical protein
MKERLQGTTRNTLTRLSQTKLGQARPAYWQGQIDELRGRVAELESEIQESRRLNRRIAELTDIVQELLVPAAQRDEKMMREYIDRYSASL